jgi:hypothetical protein
VGKPELDINRVLTDTDAIVTVSDTMFDESVAAPNGVLTRHLLAKFACYQVVNEVDAGPIEARPPVADADVPNAEGQNTVYGNLLLLGYGVKHRDIRQSMLKATRLFVDKEQKLLRVTQVDYGTAIFEFFNKSDKGLWLPGVVKVGGDSMDYGRGTETQRQATCQLFGELLGETVKVLNVDTGPPLRPVELDSSPYTFNP